MKRGFTIWWLHPAALFGGLCGTLVAVAALIPDSVYQRFWFTPKFLSGEAVGLLAAFVGVFAVAASAAGMRLKDRVGPAEMAPDADLSESTLLTLYRIAMGLALFGYAVWGAVAISKGLNLGVLREVLAGKPNVLYSIRTVYLVSIPGVTTCTQFGVAAAVLGSLIAARSGWKKVWKSLTLLLMLTLLRVVLNTERLALIEIAVPMTVIVLTQVLRPLAERRRSVRVAMAAAPLAAIPILFVLFASLEYLRSWVFYANGPLSFWEFAASRLVGYYVTAVNNGAYLAMRLQAPLGLPFFTMNFLWRLPVLHGLVEALFPAFQLVTTYFDVLASGANAEFNNGGGLFAPAIDFGWVGGIGYWLVTGLVFGRLYALFRRRSAWGLCLYPVLFLGLVDVPRGLYWSSGRAIPAIVFLALSAYLLAIQQRRQRNRSFPSRG